MGKTFRDWDIEQLMIFPPSVEDFVPRSLSEYRRLATLCQEAGMDGVVASLQEVGLIRSSYGPRYTIVCPGIRPQGKDQGDQKRVMTPGDAIRAGANYIVVGRPIMEAKDPKEAAQAIVAEMKLAHETH